ncbi:PAC2 family protein [Candidatus Woesearchaeota archaeon]|nr:PAC2 family protein [Candidatus Woesearchaeota archaeon]
MPSTEENIKSRNWKITRHKKVTFKNPVLLEGLPGIANVGKIALDYLIEQYDADLVLSFFSDYLPNTVFVNEDNLVELPRIELYHKKINGNDFLFLAGDVQPSSEQGSFSFTKVILDLACEWKCSTIITLGGIGLQDIPEKPKVFCTGTDKDIMKEFKSVGAIDKIYGVVGPIIGVSGLLVGLAKKKNISAIALLAETYGHPVFLGLKSAKQTLRVLSKKYDFKLNYRELNKEIKLMDKELQGEHVAQRSPKMERLRKIKETSYIG